MIFFIDNRMYIVLSVFIVSYMPNNILNMMSLYDAPNNTRKGKKYILVNYYEPFYA